tara:strand:- start:685 stop:1131 length:447 start_codon:yes stop_codon:yes gene_type:complete
MIIQCPNCSKKFNVDSSLIPSKGRNIQCGSCNFLWFFDGKDKAFLDATPEKKIKEEKIVEENLYENNKKDKPNVNNKKALVKYQNKSTFSFGKFLSYILVLIITLIALIIFLDTLKYPLSNFFPNLELMLYNLYEVLRDIVSFIKDLT